MYTVQLCINARYLYRLQNTYIHIIHVPYLYVCIYAKQNISDPHTFYADPARATFGNADPDPGYKSITFELRSSNKIGLTAFK